jgi:hypothetical protein
VFDLNQMVGPNPALHWLIPFADFLPSFWAKGIFRTLGSFECPFSFPAPGLPAGATARFALIFINTRSSTRRYGAIMVL